MSEERRVTTPVLVGGGAIAAILIGAAVWFFVLRDPAEPVAEPLAEQPAVEPASETVPPPRLPQTPTPEPSVPLPPLSSSDAEVVAALGESFGPQAVS